MTPVSADACHRPFQPGVLRAVANAELTVLQPEDAGAQETMARANHTAAVHPEIDGYAVPTERRRASVPAIGLANDPQNDPALRSGEPRTKERGEERRGKANESIRFGYYNHSLSI